VRQSHTLPGGAGSVRFARAYVAEILHELSPDERWAAVLLTSELVTNVVRHTDSEICVAVDSGPPVRVEVAAAAGAATEAFRAVLANAPEPAAIPNSIEPRLELVHILASRIGLANDPNGGGKVVWFELDREQPSGS
jgi:hypothetical protein